MYAVIETGGKQYRVEPGDTIDVERWNDAGEKVTFDRVLFVSSDSGVRIGQPLVDGASVSGVQVDEIRAPKVLVFKMKRRKGYRRLRGHRQDLIRVRIESIDG